MRNGMPTEVVRFECQRFALNLPFKPTSKLAKSVGRCTLRR